MLCLAGKTATLNGALQSREPRLKHGPCAAISCKVACQMRSCRKKGTARSKNSRAKMCSLISAGHSS